MNGELQWTTHTTERTSEGRKKGYATGQCLAWGKTQLGYYKNVFLRKAFEERLQPRGRKSPEARSPGSCTNRAVWSWMKQEQVPLHRCGMPCKQHFPPGNFPISALPDRKHYLARTNRTAATTETGGELCSHSHHEEPDEWVGKENPVLSQKRLRCTHAVSPKESCTKPPHQQPTFLWCPPRGGAISIISTQTVSPLPTPNLCVHSAV